MKDAGLMQKLEISARLNMDLKNKVTSFEAFGMIDPSDNVKFTDNITRAKYYIRSHDFKVDIYPAEVGA